MATNFDPLKDFPWRDGRPIPSVDPADLKSVWAMREGYKKEFEKLVPNHAPNQGFIVGIDHFKRACGPNADVMAVWYRLSMFDLLRHLGEALPPGFMDSKQGDAFFKALAIVPMTGIPPDGGKEFPLDLEELIHLIQKESEA